MKLSISQFCFLLACAAALLMMAACNNFLEVEVPGNRIPGSVAFGDDQTANAVLAGIYTDMYASNSFASGSTISATSISGLSADELKNMPRTDRTYLDFEENAINPNNTAVLSLWSSMYKVVYEANAALYGLTSSPTLTEPVRNRLLGEAYFVRGFSYFYLVNLFGDVPLLTTTDYKENSAFTRNPASEIFNQVISDFTKAEQLLPIEYYNGLRIRPNRHAASAMLARAYLYIGDWARAEDKSTAVIVNTSAYELIQNPANVFLSTSKEAIWQLRPPDDAFYTYEGYYFNLTQAQKFNALNNTVESIFEPNDARFINWVVSYSSSSGDGSKIYLPSKYKKANLSGLTNEFYVVIRLAEVYLIRAEARLKQGKSQQAINDMDIIRGRAGISLIQNTNPNISDSELFKLLQHEKQVEFLAEWGHRWLDLKRWGLAADVLGPLKSGWTQEDGLYPIPQSEINKNSSLKPQNPGY